MKSFKTILEAVLADNPLALGGRVSVDQSRFKSGRDPGRRRESYCGTITKMGEDTCMVEFDKPVTVKGKKITSMHMKHSYATPLVEDD